MPVRLAWAASHWKATFMIEYGDADERKVALGQLRGVDRAIWVQVADFDKVRPIANEDLDRETPDKTASVHFLRFESTAPMIAAMKAGASIRAGIDHPALFDVGDGAAVRPGKDDLRRRHRAAPSRAQAPSPQ